MDRNTVEGNHSDQTEARIKLAAIVPLTEEVHYLENKCIQGKHLPAEWPLTSQPQLREPISKHICTSNFTPIMPILEML